MRIAQVSPLYESVPPKAYGGTERIVSYLTEELCRSGHEVTLFASADSNTRARLFPMASLGLRLDGRVIDSLAMHYLMLEKIAKMSDQFDIIHFHVDYLHFSVSRREAYTNLTTLHGRLDIPELINLLDEYSDMPLASISDAQREPAPDVNWVATVQHGLPISLYRLNPRPSDYLAFLGRISREKRVDRAIKIAERSGLPLKIAAKVDNADYDYYKQEIEPLLKRSSTVEFVGEISDSEKQDFLGNALGLLFPIDWPEPFGLVMIEAMACGTPVVAFRNGSVAEVIDHGQTGFVVDSVDEAVKAVERLSSLDRRECREVFEKRFSAERMTRDYLRLYEQQLLMQTIPRFSQPINMAVLQ